MQTGKLLSESLYTSALKECNREKNRYNNVLACIFKKIIKIEIQNQIIFLFFKKSGRFTYKIKRN